MAGALNRAMIAVFLLLLLLPLSFSQYSTTPTETKSGVTNLFYTVQTVLIMVMVTFAIIAAGGYVFGQMFGAETRARIQQWSMSLLAAVGVSALVILMFSFFMYFFSGATALSPQEGSTMIIEVLRNLSALVSLALGYLIILLVILAAGTYAFGQIFGAETRARASVWSQTLLSAALVAAVIYVLFSLLKEAVKAAIGPGFTIAGVPLGSYAGVIISVISIIAVITLITYLAAKIFRVPEWEAYLNIELSNLVNSFILVFFVAGLFAVSSVISIMITGNPSPPMAAAEVIQGFASSTYEAINDIYAVQICTSMLGTFQRRIGEAVLSPTFRVFPGIDTFVSMTNVLVMGFVMLYGSLSVQIFILNFIEAVMLRFILPAGLILRFFQPTREAGAFLIALAFGFQIVFPTAYIINDMALHEIGVTAYDSDDFQISALCGASYIYASIPPMLLRSINLPLMPLLAGKMETILSEGVIHGFSMSLFIPVLQSLSAISLLAIFSPSVATIVTIASINAMTKFIVMKG